MTTSAGGEVGPGTAHPASTRYFASGQVKAATQFLGWLSDRGRTLETCHQADIDAWHTGCGEHERNLLRGFLRWSITSKLAQPLRLPPQTVTRNAPLPEPERIALLGRLLCGHDLLTGLKRQDIHLGTGPHVRCHGKGRKDRATPLTTQTVKVMRTWLAELSLDPAGPLFPTQTGGPLSHDAVERLVGKHTATAEDTNPSLTQKRVTPHTLRHSAAMTLLKNGVDTSVIALWLGHEGTETTQIYLHADMTIKEQALARLQQPGTPGRYRPPDALLAFLDNL